MSEFKSMLRRLALEQNIQLIQSQIHQSNDEKECAQLKVRLKAIKKTLEKLDERT